MRRIGVIFLLLNLIVLPAAAFQPRDAYLDSVLAIAWLEGKTLQVAVANPGNSRTTVTISTPTVDVWGRSVFSNRRVDVPGRTIVQESFTLEPARRGQKLQVELSEGYRSMLVEVQDSDLIQVQEYIIPAGKEWRAGVDPAFLLDSPEGTRLNIDDYYQTGEGYSKEPIRISLSEGGFRLVRFSNAVEYLKPRLTISLIAPQISGLTTLTFGMQKTGTGYERRGEEIPGPTLLVYGRNIRFSGPPSDSSETGRVSR